MLYLTRKVGDSVVIDDNIEVTVVEVRGKTVKLGFTFPEDGTYTIAARGFGENMGEYRLRVREQREIMAQLQVRRRQALFAFRCLRRVFVAQRVFCRAVEGRCHARAHRRGAQEAVPAA